MGVFTVGRQVAIEILMPGWWISGASVDMDFRNSRYYDSANPNTVSLATDLLSCTRASTGYAKDSSGTWISFASNQLRVTDLGLLIEDARTNNLINSSAPVTQTTASLATGDYTLWVEGSGSALASAGSATITGAASVTQNNPDTFTVTVAGTVTVTVTGSLTRFQLELGGFPSSFILTTGAAATRAADAVTCIGNLGTLLQNTPVSIVHDFKMNVNSAADISSNWSIVGDSGANLHLTAAFNSTITDVLGPFNGINSSLICTIGNSLTVISGYKHGMSQATAARSAVAGGGTVVTDTNTAVAMTTAILGRDGVSQNSYGYFRRLTAWNSKLADATLQALTAP